MPHLGLEPRSVFLQFHLNMLCKREIMNSIKRLIGTFLFVLILTNLSGCVTSASGSVNPAYYGTKIGKVAILIENPDQSTAISVEESAIVSLQAKGVNAKGFTHYLPFNSVPEITQLMKKEGFEYVLAFSSASSLERYATGQRHTGSYTPNVAGGGNYTGTTYQQTSMSRNTDAVAKIFSLTDFGIVWSGQGRRYSQGALTVFDLSAAAGVLDELIEKMISDGILSRP